MKKDSNFQDFTEPKSFSTSYIRAIHNAVNPYTQMRNETIRDPKLSFGALGLLTYVFSHADTWCITPKFLWKERKEGRDKIYSLFNELIDAGYATRLEFKKQNEKGQFGKHIYGYAFFEVKATAEDIEKAREEFKLFFLRPAHQEAGKPYIQKERHIQKIKKTTTRPILKKKSASPPSSSLSLFDKKRKYLQGLMEEEIESVKSLYEEQKDSIRKPEAWITQCVKGRWWEKTQCRGVTEASHKSLAQWIALNYHGNASVVLGYNYLEFNCGSAGDHLKFGQNNFEEVCNKYLKGAGLSIPKGNSKQRGD